MKLVHYVISAVHSLWQFARYFVRSCQLGGDCGARRSVVVIIRDADFLSLGPDEKASLTYPNHFTSIHHTYVSERVILNNGSNGPVSRIC